MVGLDPHSIRLVKDLLKSYAESGKVVLMSTHTLTVAEEIADRVGVMKSGKIVFEGRVEELRSSIPGAGQSLESLYLALMGEGEPSE
jgi:ABC-2 type transport system ATP-binding protein